MGTHQHYIRNTYHVIPGACEGARPGLLFTLQKDHLVTLSLTPSPGSLSKVMLMKGTSSPGGGTNAAPEPFLISSTPEHPAPSTQAGQDQASVTPSLREDPWSPRNSCGGPSSGGSQSVLGPERIRWSPTCSPLPSVAPARSVEGHQGPHGQAPAKQTLSGRGQVGRSWPLCVQRRVWTRWVVPVCLCTEVTEAGA